MSTRQQQASIGGIWQAICVVLLISLLVGILVLEGYRSAAVIGRETAEFEVLTRTDTLEGYVFREEAAFHSSNNGPVEYLAARGESIRAGDAVARVYVDDTNTGKREAAAELYAEIDRLERSLEQDVVAWQLSYADAYGAMMAANGGGSWQTGLRAASELAQTLEKRSTMSGAAEEVRVRIATLRAQAEELVRYVKDGAETLYAKDFGYFSDTTDGYEASFGTAAVSDLTPERLTHLLSEPNGTDGHVGKWVSAGSFYLAVPTSAEVAARYETGRVYRLRLTRGGRPEARLTRVAPSEDGTEALLIFQVARMSADISLSRRQPVVIEREQVMGLSVPSDAIFAEGEENFVYVSSGGVAVKRRVTLLHRDACGCIVAAGGGEGYLSAGENVLISPRQIYEGKGLIG